MVQKVSGDSFFFSAALRIGLRIVLDIGGLLGFGTCSEGGLKGDSNNRLFLQHRSLKSVFGEYVHRYTGRVHAASVFHITAGGAMIRIRCGVNLPVLSKSV